LVNCIGNWNDWSACDATCNGISAISSTTGTRTRTYKVTRPASNGGASCPIPQTDSACIKTDCPVNCIGDWNDWNACNATCDGIYASRTGTRTRTYRVTKSASNGGSCPTPQTITCAKTDCHVNCVGDWQACSKTCGDGTQTYKVTTPKQGNGTSCPHADGDSQACKIIDCPVNCIGGWGNCSQACGWGKITYTISTPKQGNGSTCSYTHGETRDCKVSCCPLNCNSYHSNFNTYYRSIFPSYAMQVNNTNKISDTQCDVAYSYTYNGDSKILGTDKRRFTLDTDYWCGWNVTGMSTSI
jgi:hypothetical protein